jgi:hypothetical protein
MPQLPSGLKVGVGFELLLKFMDNPLWYLEELGQIQSPEHIYRYVTVCRFVESQDDDGTPVELNPDSNNIAEVEGLITVEQDFTVADVLAGKARWSKGDTKFFARWFSLAGGEKKCHELFDMIKATKLRIKDHVDALAFVDFDPDQGEAERYRKAALHIDALTLRKFDSEGNRKP